MLGDTIEVILIDPLPSKKDKPIVYFTDGQKLIDNGFLDTLSFLHQTEKIEPTTWVFVSTIVNGIDQRNEYFFCNNNYLAFFESELIPTVEQNLKLEYEPKDRVYFGVSFGGLNGAFFSAKSSLFSNYILLSPITYPSKDVLSKSLVFSQNSNQRFFISSGENDAENYVSPLISLLKGKNHTIKEHYTNGGHDFANWLSQLEEAFRFIQQ